MGTVLLSPGASVGVTALNTTHPSVVIGPDTWDASDATYTETWRTGHSPTPSSIFDVADGFWEAYTGPVLDIVPVARFEVMLADGAFDSRSVQCQMIDTSDPGSSFIGWWFPYGGFGDLPGVGAIYEPDTWRWEDQFGGTDKTRLLSVLAAGNLQMEVQPPLLPSGWTPGMSWGLRVYQFELAITTPGGASPLRLFPRSDGRSSSKRLYPPPESRRAAGGYR